MKGRTLEGELVDIRIGQALCGIGFTEIIFEFGDTTNPNFVDFIHPESNLWMRLCPKDKASV